MCRVGVTGIFCDECAPGYDSEFPACRECHPCNAIWAEDIADVQRASQVLRKLIPHIGDATQPADQRLLQRVLDLQSKLDSLENLTALAPSGLEEVEELYQAIRLVLHVRRRLFHRWVKGGCGFLSCCCALDLGFSFSRDANETIHPNLTLPDPSPLNNHIHKAHQEAEELLNKINHELSLPESGDADGKTSLSAVGWLLVSPV